MWQKRHMESWKIWAISCRSPFGNRKPNQREFPLIPLFFHNFQGFGSVSARCAAASRAKGTR